MGTELMDWPPYHIISIWFLNSYASWSTTYRQLRTLAISSIGIAKVSRYFWTTLCNWNHNSQFYHNIHFITWCTLPLLIFVTICFATDNNCCGIVVESWTHRGKISRANCYSVSQIRRTISVFPPPLAEPGRQTILSAISKSGGETLKTI